jgi:glycosyltransferase involved in cell wall biosynthesis
VNIAFFDAINWDYDVATPFERPLGGSQSALCYLAADLAARGHSVSLYSATTRPRITRGVECHSHNEISQAAFRHCDVVIVLNGPADMCFKLRPHLPAQCPLVLWTQCYHDQPAMAPLERAAVRNAWDMIVCVSQWHAAEMHSRFGLDPRRVAVLRNAVAPAFVNLFPDAASLARAKSAGPVLAYTSTPYRGLDLLTSIFPSIRQLNPDIRARIYSSLKVYGHDDSNDPFNDLYALCRRTPGMEYYGSLLQSQLAEALKPALVLAYTNTFAETSCIAAMEAMAAGLLVVTSDLGALAETTMEMGVLVPSLRTADDVPIYARRYTQQLMATFDEVANHPDRYWQARWEQVQIMSTRFTWPVRAEEWERFLGNPGCDRNRVFTPAAPIPAMATNLSRGPISLALT